MRKGPVVSLCDIEVDLSQIEQALMKIESPHMRYWIAQFVDLIAEGTIAANRRATVASEEFVVKRRAKLRSQRKPPKTAPASTNGTV